jgi:hypothetical protein
MKRETAYGQAATGNYIRMPFNRCNVGSEQGLIDDPVLGQGRDPLAPLQDVINDEGDIVVPVDPRYLGLWLTGLFGDPDRPATSMAAGTTSSPRAVTTCRATRSKSACRRCRRSSCTPASSSTRSRWSSLAQVLLPPPSAPLPGRDTVWHNPGRHADQPDLQPHQPVPGLDQARRLTGGKPDRRLVTYSNNLEKIETIATTA